MKTPDQTTDTSQDALEEKPKYTPVSNRLLRYFDVLNQVLPKAGNPDSRKDIRKKIGAKLMESGWEPDSETAEHIKEYTKSEDRRTCSLEVSDNSDNRYVFFKNFDSFFAKKCLDEIVTAAKEVLSTEHELDQMIEPSERRRLLNILTVRYD